MVLLADFNYRRNDVFFQRLVELLLVLHEVVVFLFVPDHVVHHLGHLGEVGEGGEFVVVKLQGVQVHFSLNVLLFQENDVSHRSAQVLFQDVADILEFGGVNGLLFLVVLAVSFNLRV